MADPLAYEKAAILQELESERWRRFLEWVGPEARKTVEESDKLRDEFIKNVQAMFTSQFGIETERAAAWVSRHASEVALRNGIVREMYSKFLTVDSPPMRVRSEP